MTLKCLLKKMESDLVCLLNKVPGHPSPEEVERLVVKLMREAKEKRDQVLYDRALTYYNDYLFITGEV